MTALRPSMLTATRSDVKQLMDWFPTKDQCHRWGGPQFGFPFTVESFLADTHIDSLSSHVLVDRDSVVLAFGQYYDRLGRCHFGRLAVRPGMRRQGLGRLLIGGLARHARSSMGLAECSLFVYSDNMAAIGLYRRCGFVQANYPETFDLSGCDYMIAPADSVCAAHPG